MTGRNARLIRKFCVWAGINSRSGQRLRKRAWKQMSHKERGKARKKIINAMARDPKVRYGVSGRQKTL